MGWGDRPIDQVLAMLDGGPDLDFQNTSLNNNKTGISMHTITVLIKSALENRGRPIDEDSDLSV